MAEFNNFELFSSNISNPSYQPTRLISLNKNISLISFNNFIYKVEINLNPSYSYSFNSSSSSSPSLSSSSNSSSPLISSYYYDSGNVARTNKFQLKKMTNYELLNTGSIQSISKFNSNNNNNNNYNNNNNFVSTIDSAGKVNILQLTQTDNLSSSTDSSTDSLVDYELNIVSQFKTTNSKYEIGWVGLTPAGNNNIASCHYLSRELIWSDIETQNTQKKILLPGNPTCISSSYDNPYLIFTGDNNGRFSVWDIRQSDKGILIFITFFIYLNYYYFRVLYSIKFFESKF